MPIEFRCRECDRLLRTPDETAGKQAKCPDCGAVMEIPGAGPPPESPPAPPPGPSSPFARDIAPPRPPLGPENPYQSPADYAAPPFVPPPGTFTPSRIGFSDILERTWRIFSKNWGACILVFVVTAMLTLAVLAAAVAPALLVWWVVGDEAVTVVLIVLAASLAGLFGVWIGIGQRLFFLKIARGEEATLGELFRGGPFFLATLVAALLFGLACLGGFILLVVPGVIFALMFSQFYYLIIDRNLGAVDSLGTSKQITHGNKLMLFAIFAVVMMASQVIAQITCNLGVFVTVPFMSLMSAVIYLVMTGQATADQKYPGRTGPVGPMAGGSPFAAPQTGRTDGANIDGPAPNSP